MRSALKWTGVGLLALVVAAALGLALFSKQVAEFGLSQALGREVKIEGEFDLDLGKTLTIHAENIQVGNAKWSEIPHMLEVGALTAAIELPALINGRAVLPKLELVEPQVLLQVSDQGKLN